LRRGRDETKACDGDARTKLGDVFAAHLKARANKWPYLWLAGPSMISEIG